MIAYRNSGKAVGGDGTAAAMAFMRHKSVQRFMAMWVQEETKDIDQPIC